jgi:enolase
MRSLAFLACAHAAAAHAEKPLWRHLDTAGVARMPLPMVNLISGGLHAGRNLDFQDFLLLPIGVRSYSEALEMTVNVYRSLSATLTRYGYEGVLVGDEGGFGPRLRDNEEAVTLCLEAIERAGYTPGRDAALALDVAGTHFAGTVAITSAVGLDANSMAARRTLGRSISDPQHRGRHGRGRLGWLASADRATGGRAAYRRRPVRHQSTA